MRDALESRPEWLAWLRQQSAAPAPPLAEEWQLWLDDPARPRDPLCALRTFRRRETIGIAFRDISGLASFEETVSRISRLADLVIATALEITWAEAAARTPGIAAGSPGEGFAVIALGKLGAGELNYSSDVDLVFCRRSSGEEREHRFFTRLGEQLVQALGRPAPEGMLYRVDMRLRPHGDTGPLVPTIESLENYYESWGEAWERQALIKARPVCGDSGICERFLRFAARFTFARQMDDSSLEEIKRVKHRAEKEYSRPSDRFHVKQGHGGIRDIEFYVQYLQLIAGTRNPEVRRPATLHAIRALGAAKALLEGEESQLSLAYEFLRTVEHRLQLRTLTPQALLPESRDELEALARELGFGTGGAAADAFLAVLRAVRTRVRSILERIYLPPGTLRPREREEEFAQLLSERAPKGRVRELLSQYGFKDADKAWQNIRLMALGPAGHLLPPGERRAFLEVVFPMLEVLRDSFDPDQALDHLESFAASSGNRVSFLSALASRRPHLARLSNLLALSSLCHQILCRHPEYFDSLARGIHLHEGRGPEEMTEELTGRLRSAPRGTEANVLRRYRQREMVRIAYRDLAGLAGPLEISRELSALAEACLRAAIGLACAGENAPPPVAVALGKLGSRQMHYSSDLDLLFLYDDPAEGAPADSRTRLQLLQDARIERLLELLAGVTPDGIAYKVDLRLRPEGASGLLARSWAGFFEHAERYMQPWERKALVRSRIIGGTEESAARWEQVLSEVVYGFSWDNEAIGSVRHLKRRIEKEMNKESRICLDFKFGSGGISDLEFLVQLLQVLHGREVPAARQPGVADAVQALAGAGVLDREESSVLLQCHEFQRHVENHYQLIEEWTSREISRESPVLERLARSLGHSRSEFLAAWGESAAKVRILVNKYFYGT